LILPLGTHILQTLIRFKDKFKQQVTVLEGQLKTLEKVKIFNELDVSISQEEILKAISKLKNNKSPGLDNITNNMLKSGQQRLLPCLKKIFNACLTSGNYPTIWAEGYVVPIYKANDTADRNNYRGITVTAAIGKLFNSVLNYRLDAFLRNNELIHQSQIGFTKKARTTDHLFVLKCILDEYCSERNGREYACFVDFQKAFDTVIHTGLKIKLLKLGVGSLFYQVINNMYKTSRSCVRLQSGITDFFSVHLGVEQADNLKPNLFKIFINDLLSYLDKSLDPVYLDEKPIRYLMYADDIVLLSRTTNKTE
jgi:hypothetical protein